MSRKIARCATLLSCWQLARREHVRVLIKNSILLKTWKPFLKSKTFRVQRCLEASWSTFCSRERQRLCLAERVLHWTSMAWNRLWKWRERRVERTRDFGSAEWSCKIKASGKDLSWSMLSLSLLISNISRDVYCTFVECDMVSYSMRCPKVDVVLLCQCFV